MSAKTKDKQEEQLATIYECVICNQVKELEPGKKLAIHIKETLGARNGFICPDCDKKK